MDLVRDTVPDGVTRCLEADHDRLDHVLADAEREANAGRFAEAHGRFLVFAGGLARHIDAEERVLFPPLLSADPRSRGPVSVMQHEHEELRELLATIGARLAASEPGWRDAVHELKQVLVSHNMKEERVLYPMADEALGPMRPGDGLPERLRDALEPPSPH